jgi:DNA polymerase III alpha subunit
VQGDRTLVIAPGRAGARDVTEHASGWSPARRLAAEMNLMGLAITCHPLDFAKSDLERRGVVWAEALPSCEDGARVTVAGVRERAQTPRTRSGKRTCFLTMEDPTGLVDVVVFEDALERAGETIVKHRAYLVEGTLQNNEERGLAVIAETIRSYTVRTDDGVRVSLRRGVGQGPLGPTRGSAGAREADGSDAGRHGRRDERSGPDDTSREEITPRSRR